MSNAQMSAEEVMLLTLVRATRSPDPSTQNGAILAKETYDWLGAPVYVPMLETLSCNQFPAGIAYTAERWERPLKYSVIEHAERNAIFAAARLGIPTDDLVLICPWAACADCARAIIQAGVYKLVTISPTANTNERWQESINVAMGLLAEADVIVDYLDTPIAGSPEVRRDGELIRL